MEIDESLILVSKCKKYVYPVDSITGCKTFAPIEYFIKTLNEKYGGDLKKYVKEYTTRETKKYLKEGFTVEQIKEIASRQKNNKLPKINAKRKHPNAPDVPKKPRKKRLSKLAEGSVVVTDTEGIKTVVRTYPWTNNPDYFRSPPTIFDVALATKDTCLRPDFFLEEECYMCPYYNLCQLESKHIRK